MLTAITHAVSPAFVIANFPSSIANQSTWAQPQQQHRNYEKALEQLGAKVISLPAEPELPDSMFVEDPALVVDELAVIMPWGLHPASRKPNL